MNAKTEQDIYSVLNTFLKKYSGGMRSHSLKILLIKELTGICETDSKSTIKLIKDFENNLDSKMASNDHLFGSFKPS